MTARHQKYGPIALALVILLAGCDSETSGNAVEVVVEVIGGNVGIGSVEDRIVAMGTLRAIEVASLQVEADGVLEIAKDASGRRYGEGDRVKAGDTIAAITGEDVRLTAQTESTRQAYEAARAEHEAAEKLRDQGVISDTDLRKTQSELERAKLEYDRSRQSEKRANLVTPIDGVILRLARDSEGQPVANGQLVTRGFEVARVAITDRLVAEVDLLGSDVKPVTEKQERQEKLAVRVRHHAWEEQTFEGHVSRLAPVIDPVTRALRVEVAIDNPDGLLRPGMFVEVTVVVEKRDDVPVVERTAVARRGGKSVVFVVDKQKAIERKVSLGLGDDDVVEIRSGLKTGERIVVKGHETLTNGTRVRDKSG